MIPSDPTCGVILRADNIAMSCIDISSDPDGG